MSQLRRSTPPKKPNRPRLRSSSIGNPRRSAPKISPPLVMLPLWRTCQRTSSCLSQLSLVTSSRCRVRPITSLPRLRTLSLVAMPPYSLPQLRLRRLSTQCTKTLSTCRPSTRTRRPSSFSPRTQVSVSRKSPSSTKPSTASRSCTRPPLSSSLFLPRTSVLAGSMILLTASPSCIKS